MVCGCYWTCVRILEFASTVSVVYWIVYDFGSIFSGEHQPDLTLTHIYIYNYMYICIYIYTHTYIHWTHIKDLNLIGGLNPSEKIWKSVGMSIPFILWENIVQSCSSHHQAVYESRSTCINIERYIKIEGKDAPRPILWLDSRLDESSSYFSNRLQDLFHQKCRK